MQDYHAFEEKLNEVHQWPCPYVFKCIVPSGEADTFRQTYADFEMTHRDSKSGKYVSFTLEFTAHSSDEVVNLYRIASTIPGAMVL